MISKRRSTIIWVAAEVRFDVFLCLKRKHRFLVWKILVTKVDSMRKIIQQIDQRNWRTLDYFRMLEKHQIARAENSYRDYPISTENSRFPKSHPDLQPNSSFESYHRRLTARFIQPLTFK